MAEASEEPPPPLEVDDLPLADAIRLATRRLCDLLRHLAAKHDWSVAEEVYARLGKGDAAALRPSAVVAVHKKTKTGRADFH